MAAYYNEIDPFAAQWLRNLIAKNLIAPGDVDERSIVDVTYQDIKKYTQCHFFAGIGVWSHALRKAGWSDSRSVWTGSCPCQPFSAAGKKEGLQDERHLWPVWYELIKQCKPDVIFGEQVSSKDALSWLDVVQTDLEKSNYAVGALDICAAGVGAPHIRQRLYWVADALSFGRERMLDVRSSAARSIAQGPANIFSPERLCYSDVEGMPNTSGVGQPRECGQREIRTTQHSKNDRMVNPNLNQYWEALTGGNGQKNSTAISDGQNISEPGQRIRTSEFVSQGMPNAGPTNGFWRDADWLYCTDGKWRPVRSGTFPLVNGATARVGRLRAYGNAINAEVAKTFIESYLEL
ncbi:DNA cytosine methyltransferase [Utexia brackfieldae]|uniref:DNA cytosine methyltransferase n=1 Tax=Utexia brackfieldae TaxID=3074108 RepID=UPI00370D030C